MVNGCWKSVDVMFSSPIEPISVDDLVEDGDFIRNSGLNSYDGVPE